MGNRGERRKVSISNVDMLTWYKIVTARSKKDPVKNAWVSPVRLDSKSKSDTALL